MKRVKEAIDRGAVGLPVHGTPRTGDMWTGLCASVLLHVAAATGVTCPTVLDQLDEGIFV